MYIAFFSAKGILFFKKDRKSNKAVPNNPAAQPEYRMVRGKYIPQCTTKDGGTEKLKMEKIIKNKEEEVSGPAPKKIYLAARSL